MADIMVEVRQVDKGVASEGSARAHPALIEIFEDCWVEDDTRNAVCP